MKNFLKVLYILVISSTILFYAFLSTWSIALGYIGLLFIAGAVIASKFHRKKYEYTFYILLFVMSLVLFNNSLNTYNLKTEEYMDRIEKGQSLNTREKISIYGLNLFMCMAAYPLYPEVSKECFYFMFKTADGKRYFKSDFFLHSTKIRNGFKNKKSKVTWNISDYALGNPEARYALALNPCKIRSIKYADYTEYVAEVDISYPKKTRATLIKYPITLQVEEGLFYYLEQEKWLHPYTAIWKTEVK